MQVNIVDILKQDGYEIVNGANMECFALRFTEDRLEQMRSSNAKYPFDINGEFNVMISEVGFDGDGDLYVELESIGDKYFNPGDCFDVIYLDGGKVYENEDKKCECWKCELKDTCPYKDKYQRLPRTNRGALGLCPKL